ncbi:MAG: Sua5/YciO/YrdC/YwlC family protein [Candidatus Delongbacteria bacterium]|nr:Sua5/YciO/YrdC/YwlC family protein [Candidatus Delongbacteria bacterium]
MISKKELHIVAEKVFIGGVVIIPTDTIYGFSCDPRNENSVNRIQNLKKRDEKPFIILDSSISRIKNLYFKRNNFINKILRLLINEGLWPGKITVIADKNQDLDFAFLKKNQKIAVRFTNNEIINYIANYIAMGIVSTSINISGEKHLNDISQIKSFWSGSVDYIMNYNIEDSSTSTIIELSSEDQSLKFIRISDKNIRENIETKISKAAKICHC